MSDIDDKVVEMRFNNRQFEDGVAQSLSTLDKLKNALTFKGAKTELNSLAAAADGFSLNHIGQSVDDINNKFSVMGAVAGTALFRMTNAAIDAGKRIGGALVGPIIEGGKKRALNIEQAKFQFQGLGMSVEKAMTAANNAVSGTAYGLDQAAGLAGQLGAAGEKNFGRMEKTLRAVAGAAAMTGSSYEDIGQIFSKVAATGKLTSVELMQFSTRNLNAAAAMAKATGKTEEEIRAQVSAGKMTYEEFAKAMDKAFGKQAQKANETYAGSLSNIRSALGRVGALFAAPAYEGLRRIFNALTPVINSVKMALEPLAAVFTSMNRVVANFIEGFTKDKELHAFQWSMTAIAEGVRYLFQALRRLSRPIRAAFKEIFPGDANLWFANFSLSFRDFAKSLKMGSETAEKFKRIFAGFFAVFSIAGQLIRGVITLLGALFGVVGKGNGGFLEMSASIGDVIVGFDKWLKSGNKVVKVTSAIGTVLRGVFGPIVKIITSVAAALVSLVTGDMSGFADNMGNAFGGIGDLVDNAIGAIRRVSSAVADVLQSATDFGSRIGGALSPIGSIFGFIGDQIDDVKSKFNLGGGVDTNGLEDASAKVGVLSGLMTALGDIWNMWVTAVKGTQKHVGPFLGSLIDLVTAVADAFARWIGEMSLAEAVALVNTGFILMMVRSVKKFFDAMTGIQEASSIRTGLSDILEGVNGQLKHMQAEIKANIILKIAAALAILAAALWVLSKIDPKMLLPSLAAMAMLLYGLNKALEEMTITVSGMSLSELMGLAAALLALSISVALLAVSVRMLAGLDLEELGKGLLGVGAIIGALTFFARFAQLQKGATLAAAPLLAMAAAVGLLAFSVAIFGKMDPAVLMQGMGAVGVLIVGLTAMMASVGKFGGGQKFAAEVLAIAGAMLILSIAIERFGNMDLWQLAKGIGAFGATLWILSAGLNAMKSGGTGASVLLAAGAAIYILAKALEVISNLSIAEIVTGLMTFVAFLTVLGVAALVLTPVVPLIFLLAASIGLLGLGFLAAGAGMLLFATGFAVLTGVVSVGTAVLMSALSSMLSLIPMFAEQLAAGFIAFIGVIATSGEELAAAFGTVIQAIIQAIIDAIPMVRQLINRLITAFLNVLTNNVPKIVRAGIKIVLSLLDGIQNNIQKVIKKGADIVIAFIQGIAKNGIRVARAAAQTLLDFIRGLTQAINDYDDQLVDAGWDLAMALVNGMKKMFMKGPEELGGVIKEMADSVIEKFKKPWKIFSPSKVTQEIGEFLVQGFAVGIVGSRKEINEAFKKMDKTFTDSLEKTNKTIATEQKRLKGLMKKEKKNAKEIAESRKILEEAQSDKKRIKESQKAFDVMKDGMKSTMKVLSGMYQATSKELEKAKKDLEDMQKEFDSYYNKYNKLPDISKETSLGEYMYNANEDAASIEQYRKVLDDLRKAGLDDASYAKLVDEGPDAINLARELLAGGKKAIDDFNAANARMEKAASDMAHSIMNQLYEGGMAAAEGLVAGLQKEEKKLKKQMNKMADMMVDRLKKKLGIKSPSRVTAEIGKFLARGLGRGLIKFGGEAVSAAETVGDDAVDAMGQTLRRLATLAESEMDTDPTVRPVLDLNQFRKDLANMETLADTDIAVGTSFRQAASISAMAQQQAEDAASTSTEAGTVVFNQNNYSPEALSTAEVYRRTNNQFAQAKRVLNLPVSD